MSKITKLFGLEVGEKIVNKLFTTNTFILLTIKKHQPTNLTGLQIFTNITYSHLLKIVNEFVEYGLVKKERVGKIVVVKLTKKGNELADCFKVFGDILFLFKR